MGSEVTTDLIQGWKLLGILLQLLLVRGKDCLRFLFLRRIPQVEHQVGEAVDLLFELLAWVCEII